MFALRIACFMLAGWVPDMVPDSRHVSLSRCDGVYLLTEKYVCPPFNRITISLRAARRALPLGRASAAARPHIRAAPARGSLRRVHGGSRTRRPRAGRVAWACELTGG